MQPIILLYNENSSKLVSNQQKITLCSLIIVTIFLISGFTVSAEPTWKTTSVESEPMVVISVEEAYYADLDNDGYEDDVFSRVELSLNNKNRYNLDYWITLTLPSGKSFTWGLGINTKLDGLNVSNYMYDTAIEPGWYNLHVEVVMKTGGVSYTDYSHDFDPPGEENGVPPTFDYAVW